MSLSFRHIAPHPQLQQYIERMWIFESTGRLPAEDMKLVVPNGNLKLTLSYRNGVTAFIQGSTYVSDEHDITLTGMVDVPVILDTQSDCVTETLGIEFSSAGAYRFFNLRLSAISNQIFSLTDILGAEGKRLVNRVADAASIAEKIMLVQEFLYSKLMSQREDPVFEYCVHAITASHGMVTIGELEKKTGYSSRWLNTKFNERLGVSAKNFCAIVRFSRCYQSLVSEGDKAIFKNGIYQHYYDQSHFLKDFKRFTGLVPTRFLHNVNNFGASYAKR